MYNPQIKTEIQSSSLQTRSIDFSFINRNNQIINSLLELKRLDNNTISQTTISRGYELTFKKPEDIKFDYQSLKRLEIIVAKTQQKLRVSNEDVLRNIQQSYHSQVQTHKKTDSSFSYKEQLFDGIGNTKFTQQLQKPSQKTKMVTQRISTIIMAQNKQQFVELNCLLPNVYEDEVLIRRNSEDYKKDSMNVCGNSYINFSKTKFDLNGVEKIKIYPQKSTGKCFKIKLVHRKTQYFLDIELRRDLYYLPRHYIWFAKLINSKLMWMKYKIEIKDGNKLVDTNYGLGGIFAEGAIYKCSKYQKKWQKRHVVINTEGIFSYIKPSDHYTISIPTEQLEQLWTNFQTIHNHLIIKLYYNKGKKVQFAIPIQDYCLREQSNWLFAFYRILMEHRIHIKCICG